MRNHRQFVTKNLSSKFNQIINDNHLRNSHNHISNIIKTPIFDYTDMGYVNINKALRNNLKIKNEYFLKYGLKKLKNYKGISYRSTQLDQCIIDRYMINFQKKIPICDLGFFSSSKNFAVAVHGFRGNVIYKIQSKNGKSIKKISKYEYEDEVLFLSKTKFQITDILFDYFLDIYEINLVEI